MHVIFLVRMSVCAGCCSYANICAAHTSIHAPLTYDLRARVNPFRLRLHNRFPSQIALCSIVV